jgi:GT2 family glycosyltransferase
MHHDNKIIIDNTNPKIGILVLNRNGVKWIPSILNSLRSDVYQDRQIFIVDNASDDGSVEMIHERYPEVTVIQMPQNLGYCMAYNLAMPYAFADGCEWVIWANNDILLEPGCLRELVRIAQGDRRIGVLGPAFLAWESDEPNYYIIGNHPYAIDAMRSRSKEPIGVEWVEGSFLMVSRQCVEAVGPLDPYFFIYWEEADFCRRARHKGWRVVLVPSALARHYAGGSLVDGQQNLETVNQLQSRNYYIYILADPFRGFFANFIAAIHLFLVNLKQHFPKKLSYMIFHMEIFTHVIKEIRPIYKKWERDRRGGYPPVSNGEISLQDVRVISGGTTLV